MPAEAQTYPPRAAADRPRHPMALQDPDPLVRVAAVHHIGQRLGRHSEADTAADLAKLEPLLPRRAPGGGWTYPAEFDEFVARYAAVTLARAGFVRGLDLLLAQATDRHDAPDPDLDECLRNCGAYPFATLLNEQIHLGSIHGTPELVREALHLALRWTAEDFRGRVQVEPEFRAFFIDDVLLKLSDCEGIRARPGRVLDRGVVLSAPAGKQPGYVCCPQRGWFLQFNEEAVLNDRRHRLQPGQEALFVVASPDAEGAAVCVYGLEDVPPDPDAIKEQLRGALAEGRRIASSPLVPGVVTRLIRRRGREPRVEILFANGTDQMTPLGGTDINKVKWGTLVLVPPATPGAPDPLPMYVRAIGLEEPQVGRVVGEYARERGLRPARIERIDRTAEGKALAAVTGPRGNSLRFPVEPADPNNPQRSPPWRGHWLLLQPCQTCSGSGDASCLTCAGQKEVPCAGSQRCTNCVGKGKFSDGRPCPTCAGVGALVGCNETGVIPCAGCRASGRATCPMCSGGGRQKCVWCKTGNRRDAGTCPVCNGTKYRRIQDDCRACGDSGVCGKCRGAGSFGGGRYPCDLCNGSAECPHCEGTGQRRDPCPECDRTGRVSAIKCDHCNGTREYACKRCSGQKTVECPDCKGQKSRPCRVCQGKKKRRCAACNGRGLRGCPDCAGGGWMLFKCVETFLDMPSDCSAPGWPVPTR